jgi:hypothetical protein
MSMRKRPWFARITDHIGGAVNWICAGTDRTYYPEADAPFARWVQLTTEVDGREIITLLTPREARALAYRLVQQADRVDEMNREQGNGADYVDESPSVNEDFIGRVVTLTRAEAEDVLRDMQANRLPSLATRSGTDRLFFRLLRQHRATAGR